MCECIGVTTIEKLKPGWCLRDHSSIPTAVGEAITAEWRDTDRVYSSFRQPAAQGEHAEMVEQNVLQPEAHRYGRYVRILSASS